MPSDKPSLKNLTPTLALAIAASTFGTAFQHGFNTGVLNIPKSVMEEWINVTMIHRGFEKPSFFTLQCIWAILTSIYCFGGMVGGLSTSLAANHLGRKMAIITNNIIVFGSASIIIMADVYQLFELLILARFLLGVNSGLGAGLSPMYLNEISPKDLKGIIASMYQFVITMAILVAQILGYHGFLGSEGKWQKLLLVIVIPALVQITIMPICSESPRYLLLAKKQEEKAEKALIWLRYTYDVQDEMNELNREAELIKTEPIVRWGDFWSRGSLRKPLTVAFIVMLSQQLCGVTAVIFYSTDFFSESGLPRNEAQIATILIGIFNFLLTLCSLMLIDMVGRKTLLVIGYCGTIISMSILTIAMFYSLRFHLSMVCVVSTALYIVSFAIGPGCVPWFITAELFNHGAKPKAISLSVGLNWFTNTIVAFGFLPIKDLIGPYVFLIFISFQVLFVILIVKYVPETKNKSLKEITGMFKD